MCTRSTAVCWMSLCCPRPGELGEAELLKALRDGGGRDPHVWPTTALAMADGQTGALSLAARIAANPAELPLAVAELLRARIETRPDTDTAAPAATAGTVPAPDGTVLRIPTAWHGPITFVRPGEPFTPAESARAHRLAELAEILAHSPAGNPCAGGSPGQAPSPGKYPDQVPCLPAPRFPRCRPAGRSPLPDRRLPDRPAIPSASLSTCLAGFSTTGRRALASSTDRATDTDTKSSSAPATATMIRVRSLLEKISLAWPGPSMARAE